MTAQALQGIKGILFDMDGVVHVGDSPIPGAADVLNDLDSRGIPYRFLTNTTTHSPLGLFEKMRAMGLAITADVIITTHQVAADYLRKNPGRCYLLVNEYARTAYKGLPSSESNPDYIVIGDIGDRWNYALLNEVFTMVMNGARILALHKGRYWQTENGLQMDIGAFVTGLEYATGKEAVVLGKPAAAFFEMALDDLGLPKDQVIMVGDDIESDIAGAKRAGIRGVLVRTGKYRTDDVARSGIEPDAVVASIAQLKDII